MSAQSSTPSSTSAGPSAGYPVAIHAGTCDAPTAEPLAQLGDATATPQDGEAGETVGQSVSGVLLQTSETIDLSFDDLSAAPYVVAVHASPEEFGTIVACGEIAGFDDAGRVVVPLIPVEGGTTVGVALVENEDASDEDLDDGQSQVTIYLFTTTSDDLA